MKYLLLFILFNLFTLSRFAQYDENEWDVTQHRAEYTEISFETNEGTWMSLDVSPDGEEIVFDLFGNIYIMPVTGGKAEVIRDGLSYDLQPRFSPHRSKISLTSDARGREEIWRFIRDGLPVPHAPHRERRTPEPIH